MASNRLEASFFIIFLHWMIFLAIIYNIFEYVCLQKTGSKNQNKLILLLTLQNYGFIY